MILKIIALQSDQNRLINNATQRRPHETFLQPVIDITHANTYNRFDGLKMDSIKVKTYR